MDPDELFAFFASALIGLMGFGAWYMRGMQMTWLAAPKIPRWMVLALPLVALAGLWHVLGTYAAVDVREDIRYHALFAVMGTIWAFQLPRALTLIGVSYEDDVLERRNTAAAIALSGAVVSLVVLFAGSNMGEGPSIWNTVETAVVATGGLAMGVFLYALTTQVGDSISVERDVSSGLRFAGWMIATGLILARSCAGDWAGDLAMIRDLMGTGWPVIALLVVAIPIDMRLRPSDRSPTPNVLVAGLVPGLAYLGGAIAYIASLPRWTE